MNEENSITNNESNMLDEINGSLLSPETTLKVIDTTDLWMLAKMAGDIAVDRIWKVLYRSGYNPIPFDRLGFSFDYKGYNCLYLPASKGSKTIRFAIPKISSRLILGDKISDMVNRANSLATESKFTIMEDEVWLIYEHYYTAEEDIPALVRHILENLKKGMEIFHRLN